MTDTNRETLIYPNVLASTKMGDPTPDHPDAPAFVEFVTNNQDTVVRGYVYWHFPPRDFCEQHGGPWGEDETCSNCTELDGSPKRQVTQPVLVIEVDDEDEGPDTMDINIRVRRNDGLVYEGTRASQEGDRCPESPDGRHQVTSGSCDLCGAKNFS